MIRGRYSIGRLFVYPVVAICIRFVAIGCGGERALQREPTESNGVEPVAATEVPFA